MGNKDTRRVALKEEWKQQIRAVVDAAPSRRAGPAAPPPAPPPAPPGGPAADAAQLHQARRAHRRPAIPRSCAASEAAGCARLGCRVGGADRQGGGGGAQVLTPEQVAQLMLPAGAPPAPAGEHQPLTAEQLMMLQQQAVQLAQGGLQAAPQHPV